MANRAADAAQKGHGRPLVGPRGERRNSPRSCSTGTTQQQHPVLRIEREGTRTMYRADPFDALAPAHVSANAVQHRPTLLGISSAHPPFEVTQEQTAALFQRMSTVPY